MPDLQLLLLLPDSPFDLQSIVAYLSFPVEHPLMPLHHVGHLILFVNMDPIGAKVKLGADNTRPGYAHLSWVQPPTFGWRYFAPVFTRSTNGQKGTVHMRIQSRV
jgi:hypothetical protein